MKLTQWLELFRANLNPEKFIPWFELIMAEINQELIEPRYTYSKARVTQSSTNSGLNWIKRNNVRAKQN